MTSKEEFSIRCSMSALCLGSASIRFYKVRFDTFYSTSEPTTSWLGQFRRLLVRHEHLLIISSVGVSAIVILTNWQSHQSVGKLLLRP
jgi:hypothetical protein